MTTPRRRPVRRVVPALLLASTLTLASCSGGEPKASGPTRTKSPTPTPTTPSPTPTPPPHLPFTGKPVPKGVPHRPGLVVKIDNTSSARPQLGLGSADMVVEELVEGGATRLAMFLQSRLPRVAGPVRSQRTSDIGVVKPTRGALVASGAAPRVRHAMRRAKIRTVVEPTAGMFRSSVRHAPYNLMVHPSRVAHTVHRRPVPPDYFAWAKLAAPALPHASTARQATVRFSAFHSTRWRHRASGWVRTNGLAARGHEFHADNLLVLRVRTRDAGYRDPAGNPVPETVTTGTGPATLLDGTHVVPLRWHKRSRHDRFRFTRRTGGEVRMPPGHTWVELVPLRGSVALH